MYLSAGSYNHKKSSLENNVRPLFYKSYGILILDAEEPIHKECICPQCKPAM
jgi:hypothetical protein